MNTQNKLRKVKYYANYGANGMEFYPSSPKDGFFHEFGNTMVFNGETSEIEKVAIIENANTGKICKVPVDYVQFEIVDTDISNNE